MCDILKKEFTLKNLRFGHHRPEAFYTAQWRWHPAVYITYRTIVVCYSVACFLAVLISSGSGRSFAFLTVWTYLILCLYQMSAFLTSLFCLFRRRKTTGIHLQGLTILTEANIKSGDKETEVAIQSPGFYDAGATKSDVNVATVSNGFTETPQHDTKPVLETKDRTSWYMKLTWFLGNILYVFGVIVTVVYFTALFPNVGKTDIHDLNVHAFNTLQILIDLVVVARPVRLLHVIYPFLYGVCYIIFSVIFWLQDKENNVLYPNVLDWNKPGTTAVVIAILAVVGIPLLHLVVFGVYRLRLLIYKRLHNTDYLD